MIRKQYLLSFICGLSAAALTACNNSADKAPLQETRKTDAAAPPAPEPVAAPVSEKQIGNSAYYISVPGDYAISVTNGPGFSVYYIAPADTTVRNAWTCGLYLGNHPNAFGPSGDNCTTDTLQGELLGQHPAWTVFRCQDHYSIQCIVPGKAGKGRRDQVHAFGHASSDAGLQQVLRAFASLKKK